MNKKFNIKPEKILILLLLLAIVVSGGLFFSSDKEIQVVKLKENSLGFVRALGSDVRVRGENESSWGHVTQEANVFRNDRVFTGATSSALVGLKSKQKLTVEPNSLIVIVEQEHVLNLNLSRGGFFGELKKGARLLVNKNDHVSEITVNQTSTVHLESSNDQEFNLVVLKGEVEIKARPQDADQAPVKLTANEEIQITPETQKVQALMVELLTPLPGEALWDQGKEIQFQWRSSNEQNPVILEVSEEPLFNKAVQSKEIQGASKAQMSLKAGSVYFWRIRDQRDSTIKSPTSSFSYYALKAPVIADHTEEQVDLNWQHQSSDPIKFTWSDSSLSDSYEFQMSEKESFSPISYRESTDKTEISIVGLKEGKHFWRVVSRHALRENLTSLTADIQVSEKQKGRGIAEALDTLASEPTAPVETVTTTTTTTLPPPPVVEEVAPPPAPEPPPVIEAKEEIPAPPVEQASPAVEPKPPEVAEESPKAEPEVPKIEKVESEYLDGQPAQAADPAVSDLGLPTLQPIEAGESQSKIQSNTAEVFIGLGMNYVQYDEDLTDVSSKYNDFRGPSVHLGASLDLKNDWQIEANYKSTPIRFDNTSVKLSAVSGNWETLTLQGSTWSHGYLSEDLIPKDKTSWLWGVQLHQMPMALFQDSNNAPVLRSIQLFNLSAGLSFDSYLSPTVRTQIFMRAQFPVASRATASDAKLSTTPMLSFDGSLGAEKKLGGDHWLGVFWYGQYQSIHFDYHDPLVTASGTHTVLFSNVELRWTFGF